MITIENNKAESAKTLVGLGARVGHLDIFGRTPLMYACKVGSPEIVDMLIKQKADPKVVNKVGDSALTMAQRSGN